MGFSAVPSPMKMRMKSAIGLPTADADAAGETPAAPAAAPISGSAGSPLLVAAAGVTEAAVVLNSRRLNASAVHISGAAAGASPSLPAPNHDNRPAPRPDTDEVVDAGWAAVITGACAAEGATTASTTGGAVADAGADGVPGTRSEPVRPPTGSPPVAGTAGAPAAGLRWREVFPESVGPPESAGPTLAGGSSAPPGSRPPDPSRPSAESAPTEPAAGTPAPRTRPRTGPDGPPNPDEAVAEGLPVEDRGVEDRGVEDADDEPEASEPAEPVDPPEPVVSANATGTDATAEPTPNATANAPTRPTHRA